MKQADQKLILASESPRRKKLLSEAGFSFTIIPSKVSEIPDENLNINAQILDIARRKALAVLAELKSSPSSDFIILSADTEVIFNNKPLGKPKDHQDAFRLLKLLSGQIHEVKTGVCLINCRNQQEQSQIETTKIYFKKLSDTEIWSYIETGEPMDKAGAYGIQGLGGKFVEKFEGPFDNVVGLPMDIVKSLLAQLKD